MPSCTSRLSAGPASTVKVKGEVGPWRDWRAYLPVVNRILEADRVVLKHAGGDRATIVIEKVEEGWRLKPINETISTNERKQLEKFLALALHPHKWIFLLEKREKEINTTAPQS